jgi:8-oxo-dGTP pyrophosphatase MutT (NUDIX family)
MASKITCGIYLYDISEKKILIGHVTNSGGKYSIPKGMFEEEEDGDYYTAAIRELAEETNIKVGNLTSILYEKEFDLVEYENKQKKLKPYLIVFDKTIDQVDPVCVSFFIDKNGKSLPEIDSFMWATLKEAKELVHDSQIVNFSAIKKIINSLK